MYYIKNILSEFPDIIQVRVTNPASDHIFTVREDSDRKLLDKYWST